MTFLEVVSSTATSELTGNGACSPLCRSDRTANAKECDEGPAEREADLR